jgi:serine/threonine protein kinase
MNSVQKHPIFNNEYEILSSLGEGNTSKVYMARKISNPKQFVALKLLKEEFLSRDQDSIRSVENEIQIL